MPKSRKRKVRRGGAASRVTYSPRRKSKKTKIIVFAMIGALIIATIVFIFTSGGSSQPVGVEITTSSGLKYIDEKIGDGPNPKLGQTVTVHYTGTLENGTKFDSSVDKGQPYTFRLGVDPVIRGWVEALMMMKVGGKRKLIIPPHLGYEARGNPPAIPPNATLLFDVELLDAK